ncbi:MAG TPA: DUF2911 domain-containing protein [Gemmatimonadaceae bacterium]|nr:DUF2911 domain-containing protein [Gemmatimonadaceae bacterium]
MSRTAFRREFALSLALAVGVGAAAPLLTPLGAQQAPPTVLRVEPSGRATTQVTVTTRGPEGTEPSPLSVTIDYGQPHARGRQIVGNLIPYDQVWRTGANEATAFSTDVDLELGGARVPRGRYTLYSLLTRSGWKLIVNRQTGQWGTQYDPSRDLVRVELATRELSVPQESFTMTLVPSIEAPLRGELVLSWGTLQGRVPWRVLP